MAQSVLMLKMDREDDDQSKEETESQDCEHKVRKAKERLSRSLLTKC